MFQYLRNVSQIGFPINHKVVINDLGELFTLDSVAWEDSSAWLSDSSKVFIKESNIDTLKNINKSARNIKDVKVIKEDGTNVYDLFKYKNVVITSSSAKKIQDRYLNEKN